MCRYIGLLRCRAKFQVILSALLMLSMYGSAVASVPICVFMDETDYSVVLGKPKLVASSLTEEPGLSGPSGLVTIGVFPDLNGYEVFAYDSKGQPSVLYRYFTSNFIQYSEPQIVLRLPDNQRWLGFRSLTKRPDKNEYLLMAAEKVRNKEDYFSNGIYYFRSYDGITWTNLNSGRAAYHDHDMGGIIWCPESRQYVALQITCQPHYRTFSEYTDHIGKMRRVISVRTSIDGVQWNPSIDIGRKGPFRLERDVFAPDKDDSPDMEFYGIQLFPYANRLLAAVQIYAPSPQIVNPNQNLSWEKRNPTSPKHGPQGFVEWWIIGNPTDMSTWKRPFRELDLIGDSSLNRLRHAPIIFNDKHIQIQSHKAFSIPMYRITGLKSRLNSIIDTNSFIVPATALSLNASAAWHPNKHQDYQRQAYIMAEVRNETGEVISGYEKENCIIIDKDSRNILLKWGSLTTAELCGKRVSLRFYFRDATLFSIQESL